MVSTTVANLYMVGVGMCRGEALKTLFQEQCVHDFRVRITAGEVGALITDIGVGMTAGAALS